MLRILKNQRTASDEILSDSDECAFCSLRFRRKATFFCDGDGTDRWSVGADVKKLFFVVIGDRNKLERWSMTNSFRLTLHSLARPDILIRLGWKKAWQWSTFKLITPECLYVDLKKVLKNWLVWYESKWLVEI
jgi:hypothetical protein